jgi:UDP-N-acetylglucosamine acyltransferase
MSDPVRIHPTAVVSPHAQLGMDIEVGPYSVIESDVTIGDGCRIASHAIIGEGTRLGNNNRIYHHAVLGTPSQDLKWQGEKSFLRIGDDNIIREFVTVNRATGEGNSTCIGNRCALLAYVHVAHNCVVEDNVILSNCTQLGGEVLVERNAIVGGLVGVHQFCRIGACTMIGACSKITQDILPYITANGHPARPYGLNRVGLERNGFDSKAIRAIKRAYRLLFARGTAFSDGVEHLKEQKSRIAEVEHMIRFIEQSRRGIAHPRGEETTDWDDEMGE